ncbi:MAG: nucleotide exchange factor GrpE [Clostridia bacterium]|nr:nucleotide exchange factor GrpE [Clostridia bacterium]
MNKEENNVQNTEVNEEVIENKKDKATAAIEELRAQLKTEREKSDEYYEHLKRNMAEFDNFKKRISKEKDMMYNTISANIVSELLPILDNFDKALNATTTDESYKNGMVMIYNQLIETLNKLGVEEIVALNTTFDPNFHEAVMHVEDENYGEKEVTEVFRKGYKIGDRIIRHAMVKVAN